MKKKMLFLFFVIVGISAFGQLKVGNNFGRILYITVGSNTMAFRDQEMKTFEASGRVRTVLLTCQTDDKKIKFSVSKDVPREGYVVINPKDYTPNNESAILSSEAKSGSLNEILNGGKGNDLTQRTSTAIIPYHPNEQAQKTALKFNKIHVYYDGGTSCKVFSDLGETKWQGIEFKGTSTGNEDSKAKNEYYLSAPVNSDLHIGFVFDPQKTVNLYGEYRQRINEGDTVLHIKEADIKRMSDGKKKNIYVKLNTKEFSIYFKPDDNEQISLGPNQTSRAFKAPIGQVYLQVSATRIKEGMFYPTVYIPIHVTSKKGRDVYLIENEAIKRALDDLNLDWSKLK